ncbi:MAG TPA: hypothetical protein VKD72_23740, partial [Gemmataceae bacterium]|nr:hypothetical protein [Gemmataceae bacterium]
ETPGQIDQLNPPPLEPGMADVTLDLRGRLLRFHKVADFLGPDEAATPPATDWKPAFTAAGLDLEAFVVNPVIPRHRAPLAADARFAWEGPYPDSIVDRVRVEAASLQGKPVYFAIEFPWQTGEKAAAYPTFQFPPYHVGALIFFFGLPILAAGLAWWNWRAGRADLAGAARLSGVVFALWMLRWVMIADHAADTREFIMFTSGLGIALYESAVLAIFYLALEPVVRKRWPWRLVGWNRLLAGRISDPLVGRDMLLGLAIGVGYALAMQHYALGPFWAPELLTPYLADDLDLSPSRSMFHPLTVGIRMALSWFFLLFLIQWVVRNRWLGLVVPAIVVVALFLRPDEPKPVAVFFTAVITAGGFALIARHFGLLVFVSAFVAFGWLVVSGWTLDVRAWYATGPALAIALLLGVTLYVAYTATEGRLFGKGATEDS